MFDLSKFTDSVSQWIGGNPVQDMLSSSDLIAALTGSGLSLQNLQALDADHLLSLLHSQGIDVSTLAPEQLQQLMETIANTSANFWNGT